jgi:hypothetical protein
MEKGRLLFINKTDMDYVKSQRKKLIPLVIMGLIGIPILTFEMLTTQVDIRTLIGILALIGITPIMIIICLELYALSEFKMYEKGLLNPGYSWKDFHRDKYIPYSNILQIILEKDPQSFTIIYKKNNEEKSINLWRYNVGDILTFERIILKKIDAKKFKLKPKKNE